MTEKDNVILRIEGFQEEGGVRLKYLLPEIVQEEGGLPDENMIEFYRVFIVQLCKRIGQLEGAEDLFLITEEEDADEVSDA